MTKCPWYIYIYIYDTSYLYSIIIIMKKDHFVPWIISGVVLCFFVSWLYVYREAIYAASSAVSAFAPGHNFFADGVAIGGADRTVADGILDVDWKVKFQKLKSMPMLATNANWELVSWTWENFELQVGVFSIDDLGKPQYIQWIVEKVDYDPATAGKEVLYRVTIKNPSNRKFYVIPSIAWSSDYSPNWQLNNDILFPTVIYNNHTSFYIGLQDSGAGVQTDIAVFCMIWFYPDSYLLPSTPNPWILIDFPSVL